MRRRLIGSILVVLALAAAAIVVLSGRGHHVPPPRRPGAFYTPPSPLPHGPPGRVIRSQPLTGLPAGARGWRVLYLSHGGSGKRTAISGMIIVPTTPAPKHGRRVVAFAHPTVGVARRCAPSLQGGAYAPFIDGLHTFLKAGDAVTVTDYQGLGTRGPHPYLVGVAEARSVLDSVRAAHLFHPAHAGAIFAVLGHSQGGQAALFTGILAASYAPKLTLVGIAAAAPPEKLSKLFAHSVGTQEGNVLAAFTLSTWTHVYPDARLDRLVTRAAQPVLRSIASTCALDPTQLQTSIPEALARKLRFRAHRPWKVRSWARLLRRNSPGTFQTGVPILITQGEDDQLVTPAVTTAYVHALCDDADTVDYRLYPGVDHDHAGAATAHFAAGWIAGRFAGTTAPSSCPT